MNETTKSRLLDLVAAVEALPANHLDLFWWTCNTTCCAVGAYCIAHPERLRLTHRGQGGRPMLGSVGGWEAVKTHFELSAHEADRLFLADMYPTEQQTGEPARRAVIRRVLDFIGVPVPVTEVEAVYEPEGELVEV